MKRIHDTPRTDAVLNTFDGTASKLAADLATHAEELERERNELFECLQELSELTERAWKDMIIGKPTRNRARQVIGKFLDNSQDRLSRSD